MDNKKKNIFVNKNNNYNRVTNDDEINNLLTSVGKNKTTVEKNNIFSNNIKNDIKKNNKNIDIIKNNSDDSDDNKFTKNGYSRPDTTYTEQLSKEQIEEKLEDYTKIDDIFHVPLSTHLRYFIKKDNKLVFRMGGQLHKNNGLPEYVILNNGKTQWSVQVKDTVFYRKMSIKEIKDEYEKIIKDLIAKNKKLKKELKELKS